MKFSQIFIGIIILFLAMHDLGQAQSQNLRFERFGLNEGLSQITVNCLIQDNRGFVWVGTNKGLNMFDRNDRS